MTMHPVSINGNPGYPFGYSQSVPGQEWVIDVRDRRQAQATGTPHQSQNHSAPFLYQGMVAARISAKFTERDLDAQRAEFRAFLAHSNETPYHLNAQGRAQPGDRNDEVFALQYLNPNGTLIDCEGLKLDGGIRRLAARAGEQFPYKWTTRFNDSFGLTPDSAPEFASRLRGVLPTTKFAPFMFKDNGAQAERRLRGFLVLADRRDHQQTLLMDVRRDDKRPGLTISHLRMVKESNRGPENVQRFVQDYGSDGHLPNPDLKTALLNPKLHRRQAGF
jgi:hypothetical protein